MGIKRTRLRQRIEGAKIIHRMKNGVLAFQGEINK